MSDLDQFIHDLRSFATAYSEDIFTPLSEAERGALKPATITRLSAEMGRHFSVTFTRAAAEIERLQADNVALQAENVDKAQAWDAISEKNAKIERLRAALKEAPRPIPGSLAKWQITYSDWFRVRDAALEQRARHSEEADTDKALDVVDRDFRR